MTDADPAPVLDRGHLLPAIVTPPPGPRSRLLALGLERVEAPGVNTVYQGQAAIAWQEARGSNVVDMDGNRYIDLTSGFGVASVGHAHPRVVAAVRAQADRLLHGLGDVHPHPGRVELAARLCDLLPVDDARVYFAASGADAVEIALETAQLATGKPGVLAFEPAYHGCTLGARAVTSRPAFRDPFTEHLHDHVHRLPYGCGHAALDEVLSRGDIGCAIVEPVIGREGGIVPPPGWLRALADTCAARGVVLIADEIFTGFGRTGYWFACQAEALRPDLMCVGKALGGGVPIAAVVGRAQLMEAWRTPGACLHTATFLASPVACAAALAVLDILEEHDLPARALALGRRIEERLGALAHGERARHPDQPGISQVRGRGMLWGVETRTAGLASAWARECLQRGVLLLAEDTHLRLDPPLVITDQQLDAALDILDQALAAVSS
jgi:4-aminobutyrate aminotransferase-like enzyme